MTTTLIDSSVTLFNALRPLSPADIVACQRALGSVLPVDYVDFLFHSNGGQCIPAIGVVVNDTLIHVDRFLGLQQNPDESLSLDILFHSDLIATCFASPVVAIALSKCGGVFALSLDSNTSEVIFIPCESDLYSITHVASSFSDFARMLIRVSEAPLFWEDATTAWICTDHLAAVIARLKSTGSTLVGHRDSENRTLLMRVAELGRADVLSYLGTKHHDQLALRDDDGRTALHWAVTGRSLDCARLLLAWGGSATDRDSTGKSPLDYAVELQEWRIAHDLACVAGLASNTVLERSNETMSMSTKVGLIKGIFYSR